ncbi:MULTISPECIES: TMEM165/GDT1 family protein [unclassified Sphingobium]|jgi:putative Ca2+/H+ antiporter (TMEM165/GDT1 family)|uniref:TMEM165/GDT1 family protein n=1 Tax=unclassified Sphingobium TaxID=2611147 RepID=UPI001E5950B4|nr:MULTISPECIES: TMEM165/GDT1 family protein [unclassified Sphingobium]GLI97186.1 hypothetical protein Sbs19_10040 [Sphingobium sp. BS19]
MDALLSALLACALCEMGGGNQMLSLALAQRFQRDSAVLVGIAVGAMANAALSAAGGWLISTMIASDARTLFLALALVLGGVGLFIAAKHPDTLDSWRTGPALTAFAGIFILGFGDGAQFIILGLATRTGDPVMAAIGGAIGIFVACAPAVFLRKPILASGGLLWIRRMGGSILMSIGAVMALSATSLL